MSEKLIQAAKQMDWQQVVSNGGPPCFHIDGDAKFCGRAKRWEGHKPEAGDIGHEFVSLADLLTNARTNSSPAGSEVVEALVEHLNHLYECNAAEEDDIIRIQMLKAANRHCIKSALEAATGRGKG